MHLSAPCHFYAKSIESARIKPHLDVKIDFMPLMRGHFGKHRVFSLLKSDLASENI